MLGELINNSLVLILGYAYPAFECFKTIESPGVGNADLRFWCQYWVIVAILTVFERVGDMFISWVPMYGELKLALIIYLWYPKTKGTGFVYDALLRPFIVRHETDIETRLKQFRDRAWDVAIYYWQNSTELGQTKFFDLLNYVLFKPSTSRPTPAPSQGLRNKETSGDGRPLPPPITPSPTMFGSEPVNDRWAPTAPPVPTTDNHHHQHQHQHQHGYSNEPTWLRFRRSMGL
ncbi:hypothetical protein HanRHA438_Chr14g0649211 [Helianthus annuus]|uniref:HVA22-like protein n=1 Tax=Helianthus annuus TaxID=4232 RepID=A0A251T7Y9_HELAN|nr:putative HVA22-like protein g isoform X1 [Helianthus annuus]KAF5768645.1 hypothetical protein HanXRQr2_Chr14g0638781 [Helianthus annuus]KAJ0468142.1 hypothetical protein HanIR_Chr14g0693141 [Helianthus annuus]KAJ0853273.1 hypothetical protein HanRHA438_Chr14g0649211 [Helianthus annuus]